MLTSREAFKVGFLARCADDGLSQDEILTAVKTAIDKVAFGLDSVVNAGKGVADFMVHTALPIAAVAPPIAGAIGGAALAKATDINDEDVEAVKDQEVLNAYKTEAAKLRRQAEVRAFHQAQQPARSFR